MNNATSMLLKYHVIMAMREVS